MNWTGGSPEERFLRDWRRMELDRQWAPPGSPDARSSTVTGREVLRAVDRHRRPGQAVVLFSHGGAIADAIRILVEESDPDELGRALRTGVPHTAWTRLVQTAAERWRVSGFASLDHLG